MSSVFGNAISTILVVTAATTTVITFIISIIVCVGRINVNTHNGMQPFLSH
jgi:hypothetical protein